MAAIWVIACQLFFASQLCDEEAYTATAATLFWVAAEPSRQINAWLLQPSIVADKLQEEDLQEHSGLSDGCALLVGKVHESSLTDNCSHSSMAEQSRLWQPLWQSRVDNVFLSSGRAEWTVARRLSLNHQLLLIPSREESSIPTKYLHLYPEKGKIASMSTKRMSFLAFHLWALFFKKCPIKQAKHWAVTCDCNCRRCHSSRAQIALGPFSRPTVCSILSKWTPWFCRN